GVARPKQGLGAKDTELDTPHEKGSDGTMSDQRTAPAMKGRQGLHRSMANAAAINERLLVAKAKSGCSRAFEELYERHRSRIHRTAFRILRNQQDAEDAVQRSFQVAFTKLRRFRGDSTFSTWLTRIAINEALMLR